MKVYERTENGTTTHVSIREGLDEVNDAMMGGRRKVTTMTSTRGRHSITYKDGRNVRLIETDAHEPEPQATVTTEDPREWCGTHSRFNRLHRFVQIGTHPQYGDQYRARCNKRIHPRAWVASETRGEFQTAAEVLAGEYSHLYEFCPSCQDK